MKLAELLKIPFLLESKVICGFQGLNRVVRSVNMMDAPDIIDFVKPDELLITTAYALKDSPEELVALIPELSAAGCVGLGIKKRFWSAIPQEAIAVANEVGFPLIELPLNVSLGDLINQAIDSILDKHADTLRNALKSHRQFSSLILKGQGIPEIVRDLAELLDSPVILLDQRMNLISASSHFREQAYQDLLPQIRESASQLPDEERTSVSFFTDTAPEALNYIAAHPIMTYQPQGFLLTLQHSAELQPLPVMIMEQAANVISFELLKKQAVKERSRRYKNDLFTDIVNGFMTSEQELIHRGKRYGLSENLPSLCIVIKQDDDLSRRGPALPLSEEQQLSKREELYEVLKDAFRSRGHSFVLFSNKDQFVLILSVSKDKTAPVDTERMLREQLIEICDDLYDREGISLSFGVGNPVDRLTDLPVTYKEAVEAWETAHSSKKRRFVQFYHVKKLTDLLRMLPVEELKKYYNETFKELNRLDEKERQDLMRTLVAYHDNNCQIAETAKQLFVHRNTVVYRLEKCEQLTGRKIRNTSDNLRFKVAYLMEQLIDAD
ncbi:PucR family transcriptional regulator [Paenibacillus rhizophilus]|uniref:PucR family transcriptional regulator n=1 Tax=Paenibacillus rhizophilus TaxID=1850366 RepID=A0A3N9P7Z8_9BACL|nr:PucR family transcriptional regulator [Paenibacillus rhizophilus]RQW12371.1 PucR family transcriptional regulator [Paenibacillus rhizophilus]